MPCIFCSSYVDPIAVYETAEELFDAVEKGTKDTLTYEEQAVYHSLCCEVCARKFLLTNS